MTEPDRPDDSADGSGADIPAVRLAALFEAERPRLRGLAYRMLGRLAEAEDVVQEAWLRLDRADADPDHAPVRDVPAFLTTITARLSLDALRTRRRRAETALDTPDGPLGPAATGPSAEAEAILAEEVGLAFLVVLDRLAPSERLAFVLHDLFALPFSQVAAVLDRSPGAARQLASRARRRLRAEPVAGASPTRAARALVAAFADAARRGDLATLVRLLDPDVTLCLDPAHLPPGVPAEVRGADAVARRARVGAAGGAGELVLADGHPALAIAPSGRLVRVMTFGIIDDRIVRIAVTTDPARLKALTLTLLERGS